MAPNREIKFRVWHKQLNEMFTVAFLLFGIDGLRRVKTGSILSEAWTLEDIVIMQYVGLNDKKGVEVYEGDIVKATLIDDSTTRKEVIEPVSIIDGFLSPFYMRVWFEEEWWKDNLVDGFEVIGNIYQHSNLLQAR